jgi:hypothetical protein
MNNITLYRLICLFILFTCFFIPFNGFSQTKHIGLWTGVDKDETGFINFDPDGYVSVILNKDTLGGKEYLYNGITKAKMIYIVNYDSYPYQMDFVLIRLDNNEEISRKLGIFEFTEENKMQIRMSAGSIERPTDFLPEGNSETIIFTKVKE